MLIKWIMGRPELIPMFTYVGVEVDEVGNTDYSLLHFNQAIVALALLCHSGKKFGTLDTNTEKGVYNTVDVLKMDLASFGIQIENSAQTHHSECFVGNGPLVTDHPLREVIEWKLLEQAINPFKSSVPNSPWTKLQAAIQKDLQLVVRIINTHMQEISRD
eukprot:2737398-Rhodomonas_salina.3